MVTVNKRNNAWTVGLLTGAMLTSTFGCARVYHAVHYNSIARELHEHPRSYYHSEQTGRIIPKDCHCPVELPCFGYEPTCWQRWPEECAKCPLDEEMCQSEAIIDEHEMPAAVESSVVSEPAPTTTPPVTNPANDTPAADIPPASIQAPPLPDSTRNESVPSAVDSSTIDHLVLDNQAAAPVETVTDFDWSGDSEAVTPSSNSAEPLATGMDSQVISDVADVVPSTKLEYRGDSPNPDTLLLPPVTLPAIERDAVMPPELKSNFIPLQEMEPKPIIRSSRRKERLLSVTPNAETREKRDSPPANQVDIPVTVAEVSGAGDEISRLLGSSPTPVPQLEKRPLSFPIAIRKPVEKSLIDDTKIKRTTEASIRFVSEKETGIRLSDSSSPAGPSEIRFR